MPFVYTLKDWQATKKPIEDFIVAASNPNGQDTWTTFPIGMPVQFHNYGNLETQLGSHDKTVFCAINTSTDRKRRFLGKNRKTFAATLRKNGITNLDRIDPLLYFLELPKYKFVISPEGNGIDFKTKKDVNMFDAGIIDPYKVFRLALESATSVASQLVSMECAIVSELEDKTDEKN